MRTLWLIKNALRLIEKNALAVSNPIGNITTLEFQVDPYFLISQIYSSSNCGLHQKLSHQFISMLDFNARQGRKEVTQENTVMKAGCPEIVIKFSFHAPFRSCSALQPVFK
jgi:hypothetical protein